MKDYTLLTNFRENLHRNFHTDINSVNFAENKAAAKTINDWVHDMTNKKIDKLIEEDQVNGLTRLVLVNAVHFKGDWETKFNARHTVVEPFYVSSVRNVETEMMSVTSEFNHAYLDDRNCKMLELPYKGIHQSHLCMKYELIKSI